MSDRLLFTHLLDRESRYRYTLAQEGEYYTSSLVLTQTKTLCLFKGVRVMKFPRRSGILMHPTSLPGPFGIGDLGTAAFSFVDWLADARQAYWQVLPLGPTGYGDSPYQTLSAFAGNPMLISPGELLQAGFLAKSDVADPPDLPSGCVDYAAAGQLKVDLLNRACAAFRERGTQADKAAFADFKEQQAHWLIDFALFMALKQAYGQRPWYMWETDLVRRQPEALARARLALAKEIENQEFRQWQFFEQWLTVKKYANERGIRIIGDIPIFVSRDSVDVWANPHLFELDRDLAPTAVSGVPPDYFSETGQLWGHPLYRWDVMAETGYAWWIARIKMAFTQADVARIDHFRGLYNYWQVPATEKNAVRGRWAYAPGAQLLRAATAALGELAIIAEDLGDLDQESRAGVDALQAEFGYPGMKVLQFAFGNGPTDPFLPHNYGHQAVVYTGTHDNDTVLGWYQVTSTEAERDLARRYLGSSGADISWDLIRLAWSSVADTAATTVQDLLSLGHTARLNTPSTVGPPNWCWRALPGALSQAVAARLADLTELYGRSPAG